jgi:hypothetical protein
MRPHVIYKGQVYWIEEADQTPKLVKAEFVSADDLQETTIIVKKAS